MNGLCESHMGHSKSGCSFTGAKGSLNQRPLPEDKRMGSYSGLNDAVPCQGQDANFVLASRGPSRDSLSHSAPSLISLFSNLLGM